VVPEAVEHGRKVMIEASTQLREILVAGNLLILPNLPSPPPSGEAPQEELEAWERGTLELSCLAPLAGLPQVILTSSTSDHGLGEINYNLAALFSESTSDGLEARERDNHELSHTAPLAPLTWVSCAAALLPVAEGFCHRHLSGHPHANDMCKYQGWFEVRVPWRS